MTGTEGIEIEIEIGMIGIEGTEIETIETNILLKSICSSYASLIVL